MAQNQSHESLLNQAKDLMAGGKNDEALQVLKNLLSLDPDLGDAYVLKARILSRINVSPSEQLDYINSGLSLSGDNADLHYLKGNVELDLEQYKQALSSYQAAIKIDQQKREFWNNAGICHYYLNDFENAAACYSKAIEILTIQNPSNEQGLTMYRANRAEVYLLLKKYDLAQKDCMAVKSASVQVKEVIVKIPEYFGNDYKASVKKLASIVVTEKDPELLDILLDYSQQLDFKVPNFFDLTKAIYTAITTDGKTNNAAAVQLFEKVLQRLEGLNVAEPSRAVQFYKLLFMFNSGIRSEPSYSTTLAAVHHRMMALMKKVEASGSESPVVLVRYTNSEPFTYQIDITNYELLSVLADSYLNYSYSDSEYLTNKIEVGNFFIPLYQKMVRETRIAPISMCRLLMLRPDFPMLIADFMNDVVRSSTDTQEKGFVSYLFNRLMTVYSWDDFTSKNKDIVKEVNKKAVNWSDEQVDYLINLLYFQVVKGDRTKMLGIFKDPTLKVMVQMMLKWNRNTASTTRLKEESDSFEAMKQAAKSGNPWERKVKNPVTFKDLNFKLLVVDDLMYESQIISPAFDLREFAKTYINRNIDIEKDGYGVVPEALKIFKNLEIDQSELDNIEEIEFYGGNEIYRHIYPFWDGEDETFMVKKFDDIALLPNLKHISGIPEDHLRPIKAAIKKTGRTDIVLKID